MEHTNAPGRKQSVDRQNVGMMRRRALEEEERMKVEGGVKSTGGTREWG